MSDSGHASLAPPPLDTRIVGARVLIYDEVDSTNARALEAAGDGLVVVADRQTAGRGRHGRPWHSAPHTGLYVSVAFEPPTPGLVFAAPLAVRDALAPLCQAELKWPNDLLIGGLKACGILAEQRGNRNVIGIGLNVNHRRDDFPPELRDRATSLALATGCDHDRALLLHAVLTRLDRQVIVLRAGGVEQVRRLWADACRIEGRRARYKGDEGVVVAVAPDGGLVLDTPRGVRRALFGEQVELMEAE